MGQPLICMTLTGKTIEEDIVALQAISEEEKALRKQVSDVLADK